MNRLVINKIILFTCWAFSPILSIPIGILESSVYKKYKLLLPLSFSIIAYLYLPNETSDYFNIKKIYESYIDFGSETLVGSTTNQGIFWWILYTVSKFNLPYRIIPVITTFAFYFGVSKTVKEHKNKSLIINYILVTWTYFFYLVAHILGGIRYPLAVIIFILGIILRSNGSKKGFIYYMISAALHIGITPIIICGLLSEVRMPDSFLRKIFLATILFSTISEPLVLKIVDFVSRFISNPAILGKIMRYTIGNNADVVTVGIWQLLLVKIFLLILTIYVLSNKELRYRKFLLIAMSYIYLITPFKEMNFRAILSIGYIGMISFSEIEYKKSIINQIYILIFGIMALACFVLFIRTIIFNMEPYFYKNIFYILFRVIK